MNVARLLLASAAVVVLAACGSDPVTPDAPSPNLSRGKDATVPVETTTSGTSESETGLQSTQSTGTQCVEVTTTVGGVTTTTSTCNSISPYIMGGGG